MQNRWVASLACAIMLPGVAAAQIKFDGTVGKGGPISFQNNSYFINVGTSGVVRGANGFLSFSKFNLRPGEELDVLPPPSVKNIIARVTGGQASTINGLVSINLNANFFLINPAGVVVGPAAKLDPAGSFVVTTADFLRFSDGVKFWADACATPTLTSAAPAAFGFLGTRAPAAITVGQSGSEPATLTVAPGKALSLIGGPVKLIHAQLNAFGGRVNLISAGGAGEVAFDPTDPASPVDTNNLKSGGAITMEQASTVTAQHGGSIAVRGGSFAMMEDSLLSTATDAVAGGVTDISVTHAFTMSNSTIDISTAAFTDEMGTPVLSDAGSLLVKAGSVNLSGYARSLAGGELSISAEAGSDPRGGPSGRGGDVNIESTGDVRIHNHASISSSANSNGNGGNISVHAGGAFVIDGGADGEPFTGLISETISPFVGGGNAGNIRVVASRLDLLNQGEIASRTKGPGNSGLIRLNVDQLLIDGSQTRYSNFTGIEARVGKDNGGASGEGGRVKIDADGVTLRNGGVITASTFGRGDAGGIQINTGSLAIDGARDHQFTGLFARTTKETDAGNGGGIHVRAGQIVLDGPGQISSSSELSSGTAGGVDIHATGPIELSNGGTISAFSDRTDAGKVSIFSDSSIFIEAATVRGSAGRDGGNIEIAADHSIVVRDHSSITGRAGHNGGQLKVEALTLVDADSVIDGRSGAGDAPVAVALAPSGTFFESNAVALGFITPPPYDLAGSLVPLLAGLQAPTAEMMDLCGQHIHGGFSSFTLVGRNGIAPTPDALQPTTP